MARASGEDVGSYAFNHGTLTAGPNYTLSMALAAAEFSITPKLITVTPDAGQTKVFGTADPTPFTYTFAPVLEGTDIISGLMARASGEDVGSYAFNHGTLTAGPNYTLSMALAAAEFSITAKLITVTPDAGQTKAYGSADPTPFTYTLVPGLEGQI